ncbi:copper amine oxidase N-terminal domain-containing protein [Paenibacillus hunanensis]|nr:copper amine oxidase N-terminal domain-containing protein [Paenibacillus hunanensis]
MLTGQKPIVVNDTTLVPIRTLTFLSDVYVNWEPATKAVTLTDRTAYQTVQVVAGQKTALVNQVPVVLNTPAHIQNGSVYVPLRFIGESLHAKVVWDQATKTVVIYPVDKAVTEAYRSSKLVDSRIAALKLVRVEMNERLFTTDEGHVTGYYFPTGKSNSFFIVNQGVVSYYEVRNDAAWKTWEATSGESTGKELIPGIIAGVDQEWGTRPTYKGTFSYFWDLWMQGQVSYGVIDSKGEMKELGIGNSKAGDTVIREIPQDNTKK